MSTGSLLLAGLDGANPIGFLAAVGTLVSLVEAGETSARLSWQREASWQAVLTGLRDTDPQRLCTSLADALRGKPFTPEAATARAAADKEYKRVKTRFKKAIEAFKKRGLRGSARTEARAVEIAPLENELRLAHFNLLEKLSAAVPRPELAIGSKIAEMTGEDFRGWAEDFLAMNDPAARSAVSLLAGFAVERSAKERVTRTDFDFVDSSGQLAFLKAAQELTQLVNPSRLEETLFYPWLRRDERWSLRLDPVEDRRYALLDRDPTASDNKSRSQWMANLLAYRALSVFPCSATYRGPATTGWCRVEGESVFTWPLWHFPVSCDALRSLLGHPQFASEKLDEAILHTLGVSVAYRSRRVVLRVGQFEYFNFSPARACL